MAVVLKTVGHLREGVHTPSTLPPRFAPALIPRTPVMKAVPYIPATYMHTLLYSFPLEALSPHITMKIIIMGNITF